MRSHIHGEPNRSTPPYGSITVVTTTTFIEEKKVPFLDWKIPKKTQDIYHITLHRKKITPKTLYNGPSKT